MLTAGTLAPDFTLMSHENTPITLSSYRGKYVILWFYPKASTPGCTTEGIEFQRLSQEFEKKKVVILGVSVDKVTSNCRFAEKHQFSFSLLCDTEKEVSVAYGACASKGSLFASRIGYLIGPDGNILKAYAKVSPKTFATDVLTDIP